MKISSKDLKDISQEVGTLFGNAASENVRQATDSAIKGMDLFREVAERKHNVPFDQSKGNLFEYIEAAKFNKDAAIKGRPFTAVTTDSIGRPHDPADIEIMHGDKVVRQVQAKFSDSKNAAADSVNMQRNAKYHGMQRLVRKEDNYIDSATGERITLLAKAQRLADKRASHDGSIYQAEYMDVAENITDELHYDDVTSGGTTIEEIEDAYNAPDLYAQQFELEQVRNEMKVSATNMAAASMVTTGVSSGIYNMFEVFENEKALSVALADVGADVVHSGVRGGATGVLSTAIRYQGVKSGSVLLSDSMAATVMAGGIIDGGVALYSYAKGDIDAAQLKDELVDTTAKAATTIYFTKAVTAIMGASVSPIVPMAVYTTASYVITTTREILKNAKLQEEEYERLTAILEESTRAAKQSHKEFAEHIAKCEEAQRRMFNEFLDSFEYNIETGENYDQALYSIVNFANQAGIVLKHVDFDDFKSAMTAGTTFKLG